MSEPIPETDLDKRQIRAEALRLSFQYDNRRTDYEIITTASRFETYIKEGYAKYLEKERNG